MAGTDLSSYSDEELLNLAKGYPAAGPTDLGTITPSNVPSPDYFYPSDVQQSGITGQNVDQGIQSNELPAPSDAGIGYDAASGYLEGLASLPSMAGRSLDALNPALAITNALQRQQGNGAQAGDYLTKILNSASDYATGLEGSTHIGEGTLAHDFGQILPNTLSGGVAGLPVSIADSALAAGGQYLGDKSKIPLAGMVLSMLAPAAARLPIKTVGALYKTPMTEAQSLNSAFKLKEVQQEAVLQDLKNKGIISDQGDTPFQDSHQRLQNLNNSTENQLQSVLGQTQLKTKDVRPSINDFTPVGKEKMSLDAAEPIVEKENIEITKRALSKNYPKSDPDMLYEHYQDLKKLANGEMSSSDIKDYWDKWHKGQSTPGRFGPLQKDWEDFESGGAYPTQSDIKTFWKGLNNHVENMPLSGNEARGMRIRHDDHINYEGRTGNSDNQRIWRAIRQKTADTISRATKGKSDPLFKQFSDNLSVGKLLENAALKEKNGLFAQRNPVTKLIHKIPLVGGMIAPGEVNTGANIRQGQALPATFGNTLPQRMANVPAFSPGAAVGAANHAIAGTEVNPTPSFPNNARRLPSVVRTAQAQPKITTLPQMQHFLSQRHPLTQAVAMVESNSGRKLFSPKGAIGPMQLMPETARGLGVKDIHDPVQNVMGGEKLIGQLVDRYKGKVPNQEVGKFAMAAYNSNPHAVEIARTYARARGRDANSFEGIKPFLPPETQGYPDKVAAALKIIQGVH